MYMQFFLPMQPPTTTHNAKQLHAYMKGGQPHAVLHDSPELKQTPCQAPRPSGTPRAGKPIPAGRPVRLLVKWCFPAEGRKNGSWRTAKPDTDNLEKALKDEMTRLHFWPMTRRCAARSWRNSGRTPAACSSGWRNCK